LQPLPDYAGAWYTGGVEAYATSAAAGTLEIDGRRLDGPGTPLRLTKAVTLSDSFDDTLTFDAPGCWELTVKLQGAPEQLQVTVFVQPPTAHPFMVAQIAQRNARVPYPPPASCATTPVGEPRLLGSANGLSVEYTIAGDGLSLRGDPGLLFEGVNELRWAPDPWSAVQVSGAALDNPAQTLRSDMMQSVDAVGEFWRADTLFAVPGCWQLHAVAGDHTLDVTVYVYPAACRPTTDGATPSDACHPPE
jgi:hypothetical protein